MRALLMIALVGCGPNLQTLASQRHYREAVCGAADGSAGDRQLVRRALTVDAEPHVHVELVSSDQLWRVLPDTNVRTLDRIERRARFARIKLQTNVVPVDELDARIDVTDGHQRIASAIDWPLLASLTGEKLPPKETYSSYLHGGTVARGALAFFTFGLSLPFTTFRPRTYERDPPLEVFQRTTPVAAALHVAMREGTGCRSVGAMSKGVGLACTWFVAIEPAERDIQLDVTIRYRSERTDRDRCTVDSTTTIQLGRTSALERWTKQTFGPRMRRLSDFRLE